VIPALRFGLTTAPRVDYGSGSVLDNLTAMTLLLVVRPYTTPSSGRAIVSKGTSTANWSLRVSGANVQFLWNRATTDLSYITNDAPVSRVGRWSYLTVTVDQAGSAGALVAVRSGTLGPVGTPIRLTASTFGTNTDGVGSFDDDNAETLRLLCDNGGTNSAQFDCCFFALFPSVLSERRQAAVFDNPLAHRYDARVLSFPGHAGKRFVKNFAGLPASLPDGVVTSAVPIGGPSWAPWDNIDDDDLNIASTPPSGLLLRRRREHAAG
jgi:hypothetical protein